jgi:type VI secretion system protein ImpA
MILSGYGISTQNSLRPNKKFGEDKMALQLKLETFLTPIPGSNPSGEDLRYTPVYDQIKEAKREDDQLDRGEWHTEIKRANWPQTLAICSDALIQKTKDLQIAAWFTEALLHQHGFSGLAFGLRLMSKLISDYWDSLYPEIEDGDLDFRIGPLTYINEKLPHGVYQVPLCDPNHTKGFGYYAWEEARIVGADSGLDKEQKERRKQLIGEGKISAEDFRAAVNKGSFNFYSELRDQLTQCSELLGDLDTIVTRQFYSDPPGFTKLSEALASCLRVIKKFYSEKKKSEVVDLDRDDFEQETKPEHLEAYDDGDDMVMEVGMRTDRSSRQNAISDISAEEKNIWRKVAARAGNGHLKGALDELMAAAALAPSVRQKNRYLLLVSKLCIRAGRYDLAMPIAEQLYELIESLELEKWEHPAWIADVIETLYRCLENDSDGQSERAAQLFQKLCTLNITKAATFRFGSV